MKGTENELNLFFHAYTSVPKIRKILAQLVFVP